MWSPNGPALRAEAGEAVGQRVPWGQERSRPAAPNLRSGWHLVAIFGTTAPRLSVRHVEPRVRKVPTADSRAARQIAPYGQPADAGEHGLFGQPRLPKALNQ